MRRKEGCESCSIWQSAMLHLSCAQSSFETSWTPAMPLGSLTVLELVSLCDSQSIGIFRRMSALCFTPDGFTLVSGDNHLLYEQCIN